MAETTHCDFCGHDNTQLMYTNADWRQPGLDKFNLVRCLNCGLIYLNPRPSPIDIASFYPTNYSPYRQAVEDERSRLMRWFRQRKLTQRRKIVEKYSNRKYGQLLDVGCATGLFLNEMAQAGWQVRGVELTESAVEYARTRFNLDIYHGRLIDAPYPPSSFDVISFWDALEHTYSPMTTLTKTAELLRTDGLIAINVPNWESPDRDWFGAHWIGLDPPRHLYVFTQDVLEQMLHKNKFEVLDWVCFMPSYFSFIISLERLLAVKALPFAGPVSRVLNLPGVRFLFEPYFMLINWRKHGGIISVFARKL